jgi:hypothetical protein
VALIGEAAALGDLGEGPVRPPHHLACAADPVQQQPLVRGDTDGGPEGMREMAARQSTRRSQSGYRAGRGRGFDEQLNCAPDLPRGKPSLWFIADQSACSHEHASRECPSMRAAEC